MKKNIRLQKIVLSTIALFSLGLGTTAVALTSGATSNVVQAATDGFVQPGFDAEGLPSIAPGSEFPYLGTLNISVNKSNTFNNKAVTKATAQGYFLKGYYDGQYYVIELYLYMQGTPYMMDYYGITPNSARKLYASSTTSTFGYTVLNIDVNYGNGNGNGGSTVTPPVQDKRVLGKIHYKAGYGINLWNGFGSKATFSGRRLAHGTTWAITAVGIEGNKIYYRVGANQWIDEQYVAITNGQTSNLLHINQTPAVTTPTAPKVVKINYVAGYGINLWNGYGSSAKFSGKRLMHGTSWKVTRTATVNGATWYQVGANQWIMAQYTIKTA